MSSDYVSPAQRLQALAARLTGRPVFWMGLIVLLFSYPFIHALTHPLPEPLPVLSDALDPFTLTDHHGGAFGSQQLAGRLWVATTYCSQCGEVPADHPERIYEIQHRSRGIGKRFTLVTLALDPEVDTPETQPEYAGRFRVSKRMWRFMTGPEETVDTLLDQLYAPPAVGQKIAGTEAARSRASAVLVDTDMRIRGYYDIRDDDGLDTLLRDMGLVINRGY